MAFGGEVIQFDKMLFDSLEPSIKRKLVDFICMESEGPGDKTCAAWEAERFLRSLNEEQIAIHVLAMAKEA